MKGFLTTGLISDIVSDGEVSSQKLSNYQELVYSESNPKLEITLFFIQFNVPFQIISLISRRANR